MNQTQIKEENMIINVLKGAGISLLMTVILLIIFSLLLTYTRECNKSSYYNDNSS
mgnify:CR=1 FL=1